LKINPERLHLKLRSNDCDHGNSRNFSGQPNSNQLIKFIYQGELKKIAKQHIAERFAKRFSTYNQVILLLFIALEGNHSIIEGILGLPSNVHNLSHLGLYIVRRSTFSEAIPRRESKVFGNIHMSFYRDHVSNLADSRLSDAYLKRLYIMDSTTKTLFKVILKGMWDLIQRKAGKKVE